MAVSWPEDKAAAPHGLACATVSINLVVAVSERAGK